MNIFGWSYPPGCSGVPDDEPEISPQSEEIFGILEDAGIEQKTIDRVIKIVDNLAYDAKAKGAYGEFAYQNFKEQYYD